MYVPIWLHLECDGYEPDLMLPDPMDPDVYISRRMVPPGLLKYYFSLGEGSETAIVAANDQNKRETWIAPSQIAR